MGRGDCPDSQPALGSAIPLPRQHPGLCEGTVRHKAPQAASGRGWVCAPFTTLAERQPQPSFPPRPSLSVSGCRGALQALGLLVGE